MRARERMPRIAWLVAAVTLSFAGAVGAAVVWCQRLPEGPAAVVWDKEACAHCRMHIGEPRFASQLQLRDGRVLNFDDPGCLMRHVQQVPKEQIHAVWFHHLTEDRWLPGENAGFLPVAQTPMGFGLGAVDATTPEALSYGAAKARVREPQHTPEVMR